jgi:hypothetical protein
MSGEGRATRNPKPETMCHAEVSGFRCQVKVNRSKQS